VKGILNLGFRPWDAACLARKSAFIISYAPVRRDPSQVDGVSAVGHRVKFIPDQENQIIRIRLNRKRRERVQDALRVREDSCVEHELSIRINTW